MTAYLYMSERVDYSFRMITISGWNEKVNKRQVREEEKSEGGKEKQSKIEIKMTRERGTDWSGGETKGDRCEHNKLIATAIIQFIVSGTITLVKRASI